MNYKKITIRILHYSVLTFFLFAFQCDNNAPVRIYSIVNESDYEIILRLYNANIGTTKTLSIDTLQPQGEISGYLALYISSQLSNETPFDESNPLYIAAAFNDADSVSIILNRIKHLPYTLYKEEDSYFSAPVDRNIFNDKNFDNSYRYIITNKDYVKAINCNGNCN